MTLASHRLLLDLMALEAELSRVIMLNEEPPLIRARNRTISAPFLLIAAGFRLQGADSGVIQWT